MVIKCWSAVFCQRNLTWNSLTSARSVGIKGCAGWYTRDSAAAEYDWPPFGSISLPLPLMVVALSGVRIPCTEDMFTAAYNKAN